MKKSPSKSKKRVKTENKISKKVKAVFSSLEEIPSNIKIIAVILSPIRKEPRTRGKCQIFFCTKRSWKKIGKYEVKDFLKS